MAIGAEGVRERREQLVRDYVEAENSGDVTGAVAAFSQPRVEYVASDEVFEGAEEVRAHLESLRRAFPDRLTEVMDLHVSDDAVLMEAVTRGTHNGPFRGLPPTGRRFELPLLEVFVFEGVDLVCGRTYLDVGTLTHQLGVASDPTTLAGRLSTAANHPLAIGRGMVRRVTGR